MRGVVIVFDAASIHDAPEFSSAGGFGKQSWFHRATCGVSDVADDVAPGPDEPCALS